MSIRTGNERMSKQDFDSLLASVVSTITEAWTNVSALTLQALLHYHEHSYDSSYFAKLDKSLDDAGSGTMVSAVRWVINNATGINRTNWKHAASKLKRQEEPWEDIADRIETMGLKAAVPQRQAGGGGGGSRSSGSDKVVQDAAAEKRTTTAMLGGVKAPELQAKVQAMLKEVADTEASKGVEEAAALLEGKAESGNDSNYNPDSDVIMLISNEDLREKVSEYVIKIAEIEERNAEQALARVTTDLDKATNVARTLFEQFKKAATAEAKSEEAA